MAPVGYIEIGHGQTTFRPIRESRSFLPFVVGTAALLMLLPRLLGRRTSFGRRIWRGLRR